MKRTSSPVRERYKWFQNPPWTVNIVKSKYDHSFFCNMRERGVIMAIPGLMAGWFTYIYNDAHVIRRDVKIKNCPNDLGDP